MAMVPRPLAVLGPDSITCLPAMTRALISHAIELVDYENRSRTGVAVVPPTTER